MEGWGRVGRDATHREVEVEKILGDRANGTRGALSQWVRESCCSQTSLYTVHTVYISLVIRQQAVAVW